MKKAILLIHGFKRNNNDDFKEVMPFLETLGVDHIYNEVWFNNYDKETLNYKYSLKRVQEIADKVNNDNPEELTIIAYSTGTLIAGLINEKLNIKNIKFYSVTPPYRIYFWKFVSLGFRLLKTDRKLKKRLGKERYNRLKQKQIENKTTEQYPIKIIRFIDGQLIKKYKNQLKKIDNGYFLLSSIDEICKTDKTIKVLNKKDSNNIIVKEFNHENIFNGEKDIFIDWFKNNWE